MRLLQPSRSRVPASKSSVAQVIHKLDSVSYKATIRIEDLSYECMEIMSNAVRLISVLLQWACSFYRTGSHRIYLATRLLRRWSHLGADIYEGIVSYLQEMTWVDSGQLVVVFKIVAELVRSKHFSAGRYLQWLIATGSLGSDVDLGSVRPSFFVVSLVLTKSRLRHGQCVSSQSSRSQVFLIRSAICAVRCFEELHTLQNLKNRPLVSQNIVSPEQCLLSSVLT